MFAIIAVVFAFAVMEQREKAHHRYVGMRRLREEHPVELHLTPMGKPVDVRIEHPVLVDEIL